jgi:hypothetical protein
MNASSPPLTSRKSFATGFKVPSVVRTGREIQKEKTKERTQLFDVKGFVVGPEGFEPPTLCFEGRCSIQLSYGPVLG